MSLSTVFPPLQAKEKKKKPTISTKVPSLCLPTFLLPCFITARFLCQSPQPPSPPLSLSPVSNSKNPMVFYACPQNLHCFSMYLTSCPVAPSTHLLSSWWQTWRIQPVSFQSLTRPFLVTTKRMSKAPCGI